MAGDWPFVPLGTLTADHEGAVAIGPFGSAMKADEYSDSGVPVIRGTNIGGSREFKGDWVFIPDAFADAMPRCVVRNGDLVFPHRGAIGEVALVPGDRDRYFMSTSFMKATLDPIKADPRFVMYYLKSEQGRAEIMRFASQVGTPGIGQPLTSLRQFAIPTPPLTVQRAIANLLWTLDDKIELNRRMAATLEELARALFKSWFVDFDPVRAKTEGRPTGLPDATAALFPDKFNDDGLPEGWGTAPFGELYDVRSGNTPRTEEVGYWGTKHSWATPRDMSRVQLPVVLSTERHLSEGGLAVANSGLVPVRSILLSTRAPIGYLAFAGVPMAINQGMAGVVEKRISTSYAWLWCKHNIDNFIAVAGGSTFPEISKGTLRALPMLQPSHGVLTAFTTQVDALVDRLVAVASENTKLANIRDTLLPKLISGELRIKDANGAVEAA